MKLVVGLGNPGVKYAQTRHNLGRLLVEFIASRNALTFSKKRSFQASVCSMNQEGNEILLACPETFMNLSGHAVTALIRYYKIDFRKDLLVVSDDAALPWGGIRIRPSGSDGGHKGLRSIGEELQSSEYARLRLGIGPAEATGDEQQVPLEDYVLSPFTSEERQALPKVMEKGVEAFRLWLVQPIEAVMNIINALEK